jgi:formylmethanofuran dehydrogenase subunit E
MAAGEKDRLGDKLRDVEKAREDQYFAERDRKLVERLRQEKGRERDEEGRKAARMRCPKCGEVLVERKVRGVAVEECPACFGFWLDKGELDEIASGEKEGWFLSWLRREFDEPE